MSGGRFFNIITFFVEMAVNAGLDFGFCEVARVANRAGVFGVVAGVFFFEFAAMTFFVVFDDLCGVHHNGFGWRHGFGHRRGGFYGGGRRGSRGGHRYVGHFGFMMRVRGVSLDHFRFFADRSLSMHDERRGLECALGARFLWQMWQNVEAYEFLFALGRAVFGTTLCLARQSIVTETKQAKIFILAEIVDQRDALAAGLEFLPAVVEACGGVSVGFVGGATDAAEMLAIFTKHPQNRRILQDVVMRFEHADNPPGA